MSQRRSHLAEHRCPAILPWQRSQVQVGVQMRVVPALTLPRVRCLTILPTRTRPYSVTRVRRSYCCLGWHPGRAAPESNRTCTGSSSKPGREASCSKFEHEPTPEPTVPLGTFKVNRQKITEGTELVEIPWFRRSLVRCGTNQGCDAVPDKSLTAADVANDLRVRISGLGWNQGLQYANAGEFSCLHRADRSTLPR